MIVDAHPELRPPNPSGTRSTGEAYGELDLRAGRLVGSAFIFDS